MYRLDGHNVVPLTHRRWFLVPFVVILVLATVVMIGTWTLPWLAPFVYTPF